MGLIQGGPPEWIWERNPDPLKWQVIPKKSSPENAVFELRVQCGLEILRMQFMTEEELAELAEMLSQRQARSGNGQHREEHEGQRSEANLIPSPQAEHSSPRGEGTVSNPDF